MPAFLHMFIKSLSLMTIITILVLFSFARNTDREFAKALKRYQFLFGFMAPISIYIYSNISWPTAGSYERKLKLKIAELFGQTEAVNYFTVHNAQRITIVIIFILFVALFSLLEKLDLSTLIFSSLLMALLCYWVDVKIDLRLRDRKRDILTDLPELLSTLALLINAGLTFNTALKKTVSDKSEARPLYQELNTLLLEINTGKPINQAYEDLVRRCKVPEITRFVSTVLQNLNRGSSDMVHILRMLSQEAWEKRKDVARKRGEEAASKLVFPMVMVFIAVAIIVLAPAMMTMGN